MTPQTASSPKVFISYSWSSPEHTEWVLDLAKRLFSNGVITIIDRYDLKPGHDKFHFMEQMSSDPTISKVLVICDETYAIKANRREGGVGAESTIISQEVYNAVGQEKFLPIIAERDSGGSPYVPVFLKSRIFIDLSRPDVFEENYEDLLRHIYGCPLHTKPSLGPAPAFLADNAKPSEATTFALRAFQDAAARGRPTAEGYARDYVDALDRAWDGLRIAGEDIVSDEKIEAAIMGRLSQWAILKDEWVEFITYALRHGQQKSMLDILPPFFERSLRLLPAQTGRGRDEPLRFIVHEALLYAVALLMEYERFDEINALLSRYYRDPAQSEFVDSGMSRFAVFNGYSTAAEKVFQLQFPRHYAPIGEMLRERTKAPITFDMLCEADFLMYARYLFDTRTTSIKAWHPITAQWFRNREHPFPIFVRARARSFFSRFQITLGIMSRDELLEKAKVLVGMRLSDLDDGFGESGSIFARLIGLDRIGSE